MKNTVPLWLEHAFSLLNEKEIAGAKHNPKIVEMWRAIKSSFRDDETPWCAAFVGACLEKAGIVSTRKANARSYMTWGVPLKEPRYGCIAVLWRGRKDGALGHVGFVVGKDRKGNLIILGGNQNNQVSLNAFPISRVLGYCFPPSRPPASTTLPIYDNMKLSTSEG